MNWKLVMSIAFRRLFSRSHSMFIRTVSILSVAGIAIGVSALILLQAFMGGFQSSIRDFLTSLNPPILIRAPGGLMLDEQDLDFARRITGEIEGVTAVSPVLEKTAVAAGFGGEVAGVVVRGVDWNAERVITEMAGSFQDAPDGVVLGTLLAARLGVVRGDSIRMASTESATVSGAGRILVDTIIPLKVAEVVDMGIEEYNESLVITDMTTAGMLFGRIGYATSIGVGLEDGIDPVLIAGEINNVLRDEYVSSRHDSYLACDAFLTYHGNLFRALGLEKMAMTIVLALITVVALLNLSSAISMITVEHRRDTGVLRAMGAPPAAVLCTSIAQGGMIGSAGAVIGFCFSWTVVFIINSFFPISLESSVYWIDMLPGKFQPATAMLIAVLTVCSCLLVSLVPALSDLSGSPSEAVRYE